jgi:hypothetical protein
LAVYTVTLFNADGSVHRQHELQCESDDHVIDLVGESDHPHAIDIHQGERHVVRIPPWRRGLS